jgi:hypothetical protein
MLERLLDPLLRNYVMVFSSASLFPVKMLRNCRLADWPLGLVKNSIITITSIGKKIPIHTTMLLLLKCQGKGVLGSRTMIRHPEI